MAGNSSDMMCKALDMTGQAAEFYSRAAEGCGDALGGEFFAMLRDEKAKVSEFIGKVVHELDQGASWADACTLPDEGGDDLGAAFREKAAAVSLPQGACMMEVEALKTALDMEKALVGFYTTQLAQAASERETDFAQRMLGESRGHMLTVSDMLAYYDDPEGWMSGMGKGGLDGA